MYDTLPVDEISTNALKVVRRLSESGHRAYIVGGGVRDLLLGLHPKDFDVSTSAHPDEIRDLFRNSRHIGRRFKILHVRFGSEIIEVATFRAPHDVVGEHHTASGMILRDNVYGTFEEDAQRRDFTINALYYDATANCVLDTNDGLQDLRDGIIRLIGDPETRYREDPVRLVRAVRFAAKLNFKLAQTTRKPLPRLSILLQNVPPARLYEEVLKLFMAGHGLRSYELLKEHELFACLFPGTFNALDGESDRFIVEGLRNTDQRYSDNQPLSPAYLFAVLLWPQLRKKCRALELSGQPPLSAFHQAFPAVIAAQLAHTALPKRYSTPAKEIWDLQYRLVSHRSRQLWTVYNHKRFRAAYDFLCLRNRAGEDLGELVDWWTKFQEVDEADRKVMVASLTNQAIKRKRAPRKKRNARPTT